jgi:hypothetical protein
MLIPFSLLRKLQINSRQRWILVGIFFLPITPIIPIIFAILRLVKANATTHNVDPIRFQLYSMLEKHVSRINLLPPLNPPLRRQYPRHHSLTLILLLFA